MGPTAGGKTALALELVRRLPCAIVSVDSAMIYRGMDIGTAKPGAAVLEQAPHRLIDILEPSESYSTASFRSDALSAMAEITAAGRIPLLVGGTMLYFRGLQQGLAPLPQADPEVREGLLNEGSRLGWPAMHARLAALDPATAALVHPHDPQRIQRALEVHAITGEPMSALIRRAPAAGGELPYRLLKLVRAPADRQTLHERIAQRFHGMLDAGLIAEVQALWARGDLRADLPSMRCVGYRQVLQFIQGDYGRDELRYRGIVATRQLAKRQFTWLRAESGGYWLTDDADALPRALALIAAERNG
ncbi:tRNA (adenosine(37)-N6)-dimethylallyltransferase MiaA [uncultured Thiodictyon sp.]|uniref:tRNA (adenosine(37)-N6)-dimethylallyltransferase MiaA n=1 Tax=uncultured Thiodictyon sp. TaxID=1846217 RepID=UPI0025D1EDC7|nr:tRNA (adenosine(37)-N6)-dimethylallyltransferase MiaA [uncultured Thiodictyon sp.]